MIYIHVPFCRSFCTYCDFYSEIACKGKDEAAVEAWADGVCAEIAARRSEIGQTLDLNTLYIGGGTPSVLPLSVLQRILDQLHTFHDGQRYEEFTIEVNPEDIVERGPEYVRGLLDLGVTRISMGVQSLDDGILRWMNRRHSADGARTAIRIIRGQAHGEISSQDLRHPRQATPKIERFSGAPESNAHGGAERSEAVSEEILPCAVSIDLITGVPGMTMEILERTVEEVVGWRPEHISAYQLSVEEGSALARMIERGEVKELDEEACRDQYDYLCRRLAEAGYHHYEISNWALPGHEAVHNSAYWTRHPYVGLGPGAHSLCGGAAPKSPAAPELPTSPQNGSVPLSAVRSEERIEKPSRRSWNSQTLSGWTSEGEDLTQEQIHEEEVMLLARTDRGPIPEQDWFIADEIIPDLL